MKENFKTPVAKNIFESMQSIIRNRMQKMLVDHIGERNLEFLIRVEALRTRMFMESVTTCHAIDIAERSLAAGIATTGLMLGGLSKG